ncbi:MAG: phosphoribosylaminoimidazole-succinocarboxamide synthase [SAR86 cluster bacterium BACL1 MAG-120920-bin57]|jgi:phosphoribosylaminoimidazole-succinocarboxamide synthase|uniref:Phosphoribosylaminoimidazole-succinocarboxamide synthase n=2 Tax=SAR86 cluster TaxID=62672 RepID=A0A0R2UAK3_9GAMM|nr:MAG: phosphoribosylaminoimidazole-succinocarboxamide synthase [SAR86 cluster bacterium BACL1 MAG-120507-bin14]KRO41204.1 MAG: phosphoribosylaminoimidazole-succinocarboxamide synthase [SAR86 cluster bacterium BACL1 MAG-120920-bin57]KRO96503.1 MAG: phosphoribosylaminoimidazole-succinocarboxamide synthase [SAR86 cluster bacterium BACL1 MAG-120820-bin45]KRO96836.1 MAG: phosphoribosylaminoimidazole-succinocarboxamide synthase [SAR86 cluster bacterium BACL1 MAG-120828-bin5]KRO99415.1 MAG: phosphor
MEKLLQITTGKAKSLYTTSNPDQLIMEFRDDTSAFDGKKIEALDNKGKVNNQFNAFVMEFLSSKGIETHLIELLSSNESLVYKLDMFPIECVVRNRATGSLCKRLGVEDGLLLDPPLFEFFLKDDALGDPLINDHHIVSFGWATQEEANLMREMTLKVNDLLVDFFKEANLILVDYKLEFGMFKGKMLLADEFTPDGCRLWDKDTLTKMDKDRFRQDLGNVIETYSEVAERLGMQIKLD